MTEKKTWTAAPTQAPSAAGAPSDSHASSIWDVNAGEPFSAELIGGGWIDELARAANEHGIMITLTFVPGTLDPDEETTA